MSRASGRYDLHEVGRLPVPGDNAAIAVRRLDAGTRIAYEGQEFALDYTILEGHRFAIRPIAPGEALLSWGLPFGYATVPIAPGSYARNPKILKALAARRPRLRAAGRGQFPRQPAGAVRARRGDFPPRRRRCRATDAAARTFPGYRRGGDRGVGTRNHIVILGDTSRTASWAKALEARFAGSTDGMPNVDGVVAVAHTEGGGADQPEQPRLAAADAGRLHRPPECRRGAGRGRRLRRGHQPRRLRASCASTATRSTTCRTASSRCAAASRPTWRPRRGDSSAPWLPRPPRRRAPRSRSPTLKIGLQCGGSDAFSGISGNPLAGWVARRDGAARRRRQSGGDRRADRRGGLRAAERARFRDRPRVPGDDRAFKERVGWHGHTAEGNPSGGNNFRGLYNIALKSIGAAAKKRPDVRLDYVIDYGERMLGTAATTSWTAPATTWRASPARSRPAAT